MGIQAQERRDQRNVNQRPAPGGDPAQAPKDVPTPRAEQDTDKSKDKEGFGHIGNKDVPASEGTPEPHQIF